MSTIVPTLTQAIRNIENFKAELDTSTELQRRLAFARAWYAYLDNTGSWLFGPSKFCGYKDMTAAEYVNDEPRNGRRTEKQLQSWFTQVPEDDELYEELSEALTAFLGQYGKPPSSAFRINVTNDYYQSRSADDSALDDRTIGDLLIAVAQRLSTAERVRLRAAL
ncbi:hypothetical protein [Phyllobacterium leguminum]|nr:hypothetical protein [Phyllobacterium leguminum]